MKEYDIDFSNVVVETMDNLAGARALTDEEELELFKDFFRSDYVEKYVCPTDENFFMEITWTNGKSIKAVIVDNGKEFDITEFIHKVK